MKERLPQQELENLSYIKPESLSKVYEKERELLAVIDLRSPEEYKKEHMNMAINLPFEFFDIHRLATILDKKRTYLVYSNKDEITEKVSTLFAAQHINKVYALMGNWQQGKQLKKIEEKAQLQQKKKVPKK